MNITNILEQKMKPASALLCLALAAAFAPTTAAQEVLPFPPKPSGSIAGRDIQESVYHPLPAPKHLPDGAPNILIILMDDVGPGTASAYGGEIQTPTLDRVANAGISYNRFHTTAMCSPTRASLLTGRNHHRVGSGVVPEFANDWDGYSGVMPKSAATVAEVLRHYGYQSGAWGKWHNTPATDTSAAGPFTYWPTSYGFDYFYGFLAGEASHWEPNLVRNTTVVHPNPPKDGKPYHLTEDIADDAIHWLREQQSFAPGKPFLMYWAPGAAHAPHHITKEWADKYKGKFDDGWDKYRERVFKRQKEMGWIPQDAQMTPRPATLPAWDSIPEDEKPFQRRLFEVFAGFAAHADYNAGRVIAEIERQGKLDNTLIFYIWGDNGSSAEGQQGTLAELMVFNGIPSTVKQQIATLNTLGGLDALGSPKTDNHYNAAWAWAGSTPYKSTKLVAAHFGGTRNPMAVSWPVKIKHDKTPRAQFHHVNDVVPTIYEVVGITPPRVVHGIPQIPLDGISLAYTFTDAKAKGRKRSQYFEEIGSRAIYHDGWVACAFGPRTPWIPGMPPGMKEWTPDKDTWELYNLEEDWSEANDLAAKMPEKVAQMKEMFSIEAARNSVYPIGGGLLALFNPEVRKAGGPIEWTFSGEITRLPELAAPKLGNTPSLVTVEADVPANANGVLYALGGFTGGLSCYMKDGVLSYEYNLFTLMRTQIKAKDRLPAGKTKIEVETSYVVARPGGPLKIVMKVNGKPIDTITTVNGHEVKAAGKHGELNVAPQMVPVSAPVLFTSQESLDIGSDVSSPVSLDYFDLAPFKFNGKIGQVQMKYMK